MKNELMTDFSVDKKNKTVKVKRAFDAPEKHVWAAWTEPELLDQWWAPKPWKSETKAMDFREDGRTKIFCNGKLGRTRALVNSERFGKPDLIN